MRVKYSCTNENLKTIIRGLDVKPDDYVLMVGGSGDQALAVLEYAGKVLVVDVDPLQAYNMMERVIFIKNGDYKRFWNERRGFWSGSDGMGYFIKERLDRIRGKIQLIDIREADILDVCQEENGFNKVYLSNALDGHSDELGPRLKVISQNIPFGGLVYASNGETIYGALDRTGLVIDEDLVDIVLHPEFQDAGWHPIVLRKIHESEPLTALERAFL